MKNTAVLYVFAGILLGLMVSRISVVEPLWFTLLIPAGLALTAALGMDNS